MLHVPSQQVSVMEVDVATSWTLSCCQLPPASPQPSFQKGLSTLELPLGLRLWGWATRSPGAPSISVVQLVENQGWIPPRQHCPTETPWLPFRMPGEVNGIQGSCPKERRPRCLVTCDLDLGSKRGREAKRPSPRR